MYGEKAEALGSARTDLNSVDSKSYIDKEDSSLVSIGDNNNIDNLVNSSVHRNSSTVSTYDVPQLPSSTYVLMPTNEFPFSGGRDNSNDSNNNNTNLISNNLNLRKQVDMNYYKQKGHIGTETKLKDEYIQRNGSTTNSVFPLNHMHFTKQHLSEQVQPRPNNFPFPLNQSSAPRTLWNENRSEGNRNNEPELRNP